MAYWYERRATASRRATSTPDELPAWVSAVERSRADSRRRSFASCRTPGYHQRGDPGPHGRVDDYHAESAETQTRQRPSHSGRRPREAFAKNVYSSPFLDRLSLDFRTGAGRPGGARARRLLRTSWCWRSLLRISWDTTYGPESHEVPGRPRAPRRSSWVVFMHGAGGAGSARGGFSGRAHRGPRRPHPAGLAAGDGVAVAARLEGGRMGLRWPAYRPGDPHAPAASRRSSPGRSAWLVRPTDAG